MKVNVTGRHISISERLKEYSEKKIVKLEKYFNQVIEFKLVYYSEKMDKTCEVLIYADGVHFHGIEKAGDFYSALDILMDKLEQQVKKFKEKHQLHKGTHLGEVPIVDLHSDDDEKMNIVYNEVSSKPSSDAEAYLQLKVDGDYFRVYKNEKGESAVLFGGNGQYKLSVASSDIAEYDLQVVKDSWTNPEIKMDKSSVSVKKMNVADALNELVSSERWFIPFVNVDSGAHNVVYQKGKRVELMMVAEK
ncbi:MAG TPA: ribosome-associated translation inhibitor RaiA [Spirochaetota bacterium]|nr:ribosome-associated translation inhibitor RaiA [Spirochaetota bacterium]HQQ23799.1 ribosome-associated translation inhibitor RaiA [Spirochaetota bacterium]